MPAPPPPRPLRARQGARTNGKRWHKAGKIFEAWLVPQNATNTIAHLFCISNIHREAAHIMVWVLRACRFRGLLPPPKQWQPHGASAAPPKKKITCGLSAFFHSFWSLVYFSGQTPQVAWRADFWGVLDFFR